MRAEMHPTPSSEEDFLLIDQTVDVLPVSDEEPSLQAEAGKEDVQAAAAGAPVINDMPAAGGLTALSTGSYSRSSIGVASLKEDCSDSDDSDLDSDEISVCSTVSISSTSWCKQSSRESKLWRFTGQTLRLGCFLISLAASLVVAPVPPAWASQLAQAIQSCSYRCLLPVAGCAALASLVCPQWLTRQPGVRGPAARLARQPQGVPAAVLRTIPALIILILSLTYRPPASAPRASVLGHNTSAISGQLFPTGRVHKPSCVPSISLAASHVEQAHSLLSELSSGRSSASQVHAMKQLEAARALLAQAAACCVDEAHASPTDQSAATQVPIQEQHHLAHQEQNTGIQHGASSEGAHGTGSSQGGGQREAEREHSLVDTARLSAVRAELAAVEGRMYSSLLALGHCRALMITPGTTSGAQQQAAQEHPAQELVVPVASLDPPRSQRYHSTTFDSDVGAEADASLLLGSDCSTGARESLPTQEGTTWLEAQQAQTREALQTKLHHLYAITAAVSVCEQQLQHKQGAQQQQQQQSPLQATSSCVPGQGQEPETEPGHAAATASAGERSAAGRATPPFQGWLGSLTSGSTALGSDRSKGRLEHAAQQVKSTVSEVTQQALSQAQQGLQQLHASTAQQLRAAGESLQVGVAEVSALASSAVQEVKARSAAGAVQVAAGVKEARRVTRIKLKPLEAAIRRGVKRAQRRWVAA